MNWFRSYNRDKRLARLRAVLKNDIERFISIYTKHIEDGWFPMIGKRVKFPVPMPYYGEFSLERVAHPSGIIGEAMEEMFFKFSLQRDDNGRCNFPRYEIIKISRAIGVEAGVPVDPDFSSLPQDYLGETSDFNAFRQRPDLYDI